MLIMSNRGVWRLSRSVDNLLPHATRESYLVQTILTTGCMVPSKSLCTN
jgi:hypothetical protein